METPFNTINKVAAELEYLMDWYEMPDAVQEAHDKLCDALRVLATPSASVRSEAKSAP